MQCTAHLDACGGCRGACQGAARQQAPHGALDGAGRRRPPLELRPPALLYDGRGPPAFARPSNSAPEVGSAGAMVLGCTVLTA